MKPLVQEKISNISEVQKYNGKNITKSLLLKKFKLVVSVLEDFCFSAKFTPSSAHFKTTPSSLYFIYLHEVATVKDCTWSTSKGFFLVHFTF